MISVKVEGADMKISGRVCGKFKLNEDLMENSKLTTRIVQSSPLSLHLSMEHLPYPHFSYSLSKTEVLQVSVTWTIDFSYKTKIIELWAIFGHWRSVIWSVIPFPNHLRDKFPNFDQTFVSWAILLYAICQDDICPCSICPGDIWPYKQYLTKIQPNFLDPILWGSKKFWTTILLDPNFWDPKLFGPKIILDLKFFLDPIFLDQNYFGSKILF